MSDTPLDDDLHEAMARFSAAANAEKVELPVIEPPAKVLVAFDQSNQDDSVALLAKQVCTRYGATAVLTLATPGIDVETRRKHLEAMQAKLSGLTCEIAPQQDDEDPADRIIDAKRDSGAKFLIMPAPYLEDLNTLGRDSLGSTTERVLARATVPVLLAREARDDLSSALDRPLIKLHVRQREAAKAMSISFGLCGKSAAYHMLFVVEHPGVRPSARCEPCRNAGPRLGEDTFRRPCRLIQVGDQIIHDDGVSRFSRNRSHVQILHVLQEASPALAAPQ